MLRWGGVASLPLREARRRSFTRKYVKFMNMNEADNANVDSDVDCYVNDDCRCDSDANVLAQLLPQVARHVAPATFGQQLRD